MKEQSFVGKSNTAESEKDLWQTPQRLFDKLNEEFQFTLDVCASEKNALCDKFFTEKDNSLDISWADETCFCNPPYSRTAEFVEYAAAMASSLNVTTVMLLNANTDTGWFSKAASSASEIRLITGRISFVKPSGGKAGGNPKGQCVIIFRGKCKTKCHITMINRSEFD